MSVFVETAAVVAREASAIIEAMRLEGIGYELKGAADNKAFVTVSVDGFAHRKNLDGMAKVEDSVNGSIMRWGIHHEGPDFKLSHDPDFKLTGIMGDVVKLAEAAALAEA